MSMVIRIICVCVSVCCCMFVCVYEYIAGCVPVSQRAWPRVHALDSDGNVTWESRETTQDCIEITMHKLNTVV